MNSKIYFKSYFLLNITVEIIFRIKNQEYLRSDAEESRRQLWATSEGSEENFLVMLPAPFSRRQNIMLGFDKC